MRVNTGKTQMICISGAVTYVAESYIGDGEGGVIQSTTESIKILGFHLSSKPGVSAHVTALRKKFRKRLWVILNLRELGFTEAELVKVYTSYVHPIADYMAPAYHSLLTDAQNEEIERLQSTALKYIFGPFISAGKMREKAGVQTLRQRRIELTDKFAEKALTNPRCRHWFPLRAARSGRHGEKYLERKARCDRLHNSPLFYYRRRLNGKVGKTYGQRNRYWREKCF